MQTESSTCHASTCELWSELDVTSQRRHFSCSSKYEKPVSSFLTQPATDQAQVVPVFLLRHIYEHQQEHKDIDVHQLLVFCFCTPRPHPKAHATCRDAPPEHITDQLWCCTLTGQSRPWRKQALLLPWGGGYGDCYLDRLHFISWHNPTRPAEVFTENKITPAMHLEWDPETQGISASGWWVQ